MNAINRLVERKPTRQLDPEMNPTGREEPARLQQLNTKQHQTIWAESQSTFKPQTFPAVNTNKLNIFSLLTHN